jgi:hypothetical protein
VQPKAEHDEDFVDDGGNNDNNNNNNQSLISKH